MFIIPNQILSFLQQLPLPKGPLVVAVSGGADSLYLTYLLQGWCCQNKRKLFAVTVDHGLRPEASNEAAWVHKQLTKQDVDHTILVWNGPKPRTRLEERAREKRYELLIQFCREKKASALFLAHHQQDQVETFWARLARGSGLDGLSGILPLTKRDNILIVRPLLKMSKVSILQQMEKKHFKWAEDPMNRNPAYERVRWRQNQAILDQMGLPSQIVAKSIGRLQRAKEALTFYADEFILKHVSRMPFGCFQMEEASFCALPLEIRIRVLMSLLKKLTPKKAPISMESVENIVINFSKYATLAGCQWVVFQHKIFLAQELRFCKKALIPAYQKTAWANCWIYTNASFVAEAAPPKPRMEQIPFLIQRTFLKIPKGFMLIENKEDVCRQKELEKKLKLDYKNNKPFVLIQFNEQKEER